MQQPMLHHIIQGAKSKAHQAIPFATDASKPMRKAKKKHVLLLLDQLIDEQRDRYIKNLQNLEKQVTGASNNAAELMQMLMRALLHYRYDETDEPAPALLPPKESAAQIFASMMRQDVVTLTVPIEKQQLHLHVYASAATQVARRRFMELVLASQPDSKDFRLPLLYIAELFREVFLAKYALCRVQHKWLSQRDSTRRAFARLFVASNENDDSLPLPQQQEEEIAFSSAHFDEFIEQQKQFVVRDMPEKYELLSERLVQFLRGQYRLEPTDFDELQIALQEETQKPSIKQNLRSKGKQLSASRMAAEPAAAVETTDTVAGAASMILKAVSKDNDPNRSNYIKLLQKLIISHVYEIEKRAGQPAATADDMQHHRLSSEKQQNSSSMWQSFLAFVRDETFVPPMTSSFVPRSWTGNAVFVKEQDLLRDAHDIALLQRTRQRKRTQRILASDLHSILEKQKAMVDYIRLVGS